MVALEPAVGQVELSPVSTQQELRQPSVPVEAPRPAQTPEPHTRARRPEVRSLVVGDTWAGAALIAADPAVGAVAMASTVLAYAAAGLYRRQFTLSVLDDTPRMVRALGLALGPAVGLALVQGTSVAAAAGLAVFLAVGIFLGRVVTYTLLRGARRRGSVTFPLIVVSDEQSDISDLIRRVEEHPETGLRLVGVSDPAGTVSLGAHAQSLQMRIEEIVARFDVREVIVTPDAGSVRTASLIRSLARSGLRTHVLIPQVGATPHRGWDDHVWGLPLLRLKAAQRWRRARHLKRATDVALAGGALLALSPLLAVVAVLVRREVGPGILFRQERIGLNGRSFPVLKFRSMKSLPPGEISPWSVKSADRIGPVGRFIRKYSIDELPQLWNIVRGEMSLVGPRPERPEFVTEFAATVPHYCDRHRAPVGLTGLAAVEGLRGDTSISDRAYFDNLYVDSWTYWSDLKIIARTVLAVFRGTGS